MHFRRPFLYYRSALKPGPTRFEQIASEAHASTLCHQATQCDKARGQLTVLSP